MGSPLPQIFDKGGGGIVEASVVDQCDRPPRFRCRSHGGGFLGGIGDVDAAVWKEPSQADRDEFDLFGMFIDDEDRHGFVRRHRPVPVVSRGFEQAQFQSGQIAPCAPLCETDRSAQAREKTICCAMVCE